MHKLKYFALALSLTLAAGVLSSAQAQRRTTTATALYEFEGNEVARGAVAGTSDTFYVTYAGKVKTRSGKSSASVRSFTISLQYSASGRTGTVTSGQWTLTTVREGLPTTLGGSVRNGLALSLNANQTVARGTYTLPFTGDDPTWPTFGVFTLTVDRGTPAKVAGTFTLTYPVVL